MNMYIIGIFTYFGLLFFIYSTYEAKWSKTWKMWILISFISLIGICGLIEDGMEYPTYSLYLGLSYQIFVYSLIQVLRFMSKKVNGRDFIFDSRFSKKRYRTGIDSKFFKSTLGYKKLPRLKLFDVMASLIIIFIPIFGYMIGLSFKQ